MYRAFYNRSSNERDKRVVGDFADKLEAAKACFAEAKRCGDTYDCDKESDVIEALMNRDFYCVGYGPRECSIVEVN